MQFKIYKRLNTILYAMLAPVFAAIAVVLFNFNYFSQYLIIVFVCFFIYNISCFLLYKSLEKNWDKRLIQKMAINNQVVIANIKSSKLAFKFRDSSNAKFGMWEINVEYIDHDMSSHEFVIFEKLNVNVESIPLGTVFMTNDDSKPGRKFIVPNVIISHIESLMPIVQAYEKEKKAYIKYLNVYYNNGLVIETFSQSMKKQNTES